MRSLDTVSLPSKLAEKRREGRSIGFVPTMGALHEGHLSLVRRARSECDRVVLSIFVNPLQFSPSEDLTAYPRDLEGDAAMAEAAGVDYLFAPSAEEIYPRGDLDTRVLVGRLAEHGEGVFRPGHFEGVATVCLKLFNIVRPDRAYFGEKDAQQLAVVRRVAHDLDIPLEIVGCPTVREPDGLALSSRNRYLSAGGRRAATVLSRALFEARSQALAGEVYSEELRSIVEKLVSDQPLVELQYAEVFDPETFVPVEKIDGSAVLALAALVEGTRLIDNVTIDLSEGGAK